MKYLIAMVIVILASSTAVAILAAIAAVWNASGELQKEQEDMEQEEFLREWMKAREKKKSLCD